MPKDSGKENAATPGRAITPGAILRIFLSLALVSILALQWELVDWLTPFILFPLQLVAASLYAMAFCWELVLLFRRPLNWRTSLSGVVVLACGVAALFVPFTDLWLEWNFDRYETERLKVVEMVQAGTLVPNVPHNPSLIALPDRSPCLSQGGNEIVVEEHEGGQYVFFFTYRGILDNYSGFLCVPPGGDPRLFSDLGEKDTTQLVAVRGRWIYASHW